MKKSVALVLSSGGSKGLAHIGVINELEKQGFMISSIAGSSIGSVIGGLYAMGKLPEYTDWIKSLDQKSIWGLMDFTIADKNNIHRLGELCRTREVLVDYFFADNQYGSFDRIWQKYFRAFTWKANLSAGK